MPKLRNKGATKTPIYHFVTWLKPFKTYNNESYFENYIKLEPRATKTLVMKHKLL